MAATQRSTQKRMKQADIRGMNRENLNRLSLGMSKEKVLEVMGVESFKTKEPFGSGRQSETISNPYRTEILTSKDGQTAFEVLFYYTDDKQRDDAITDDELTPLVIQNGKLVGWGWSFMDQTVAKYEIRVR
jgi:hypothetical protein